MIKRIRYMKSSEGCLVSVRAVETAFGHMTIKLYPDNRALLINAATNEVIRTLQAPTAHEIKKEIKKNLQDFGAVFEPEKRKPQHDS